MRAAGALHVVATPIGHLDDITFRAVEVLRSCPVVAAEDTRRLRILAERYDLHPRRVLRCDERTEAAAAPQVLAILGGGEDVALTTDAGTPAVADPGRRLVRRARDAGYRVVPVPGPCAPVAALSASGLAADRFLFGGFPPRRAAPLGTFLDALLPRPETLLLLESPERALGLLAAIAERAPARRVVLARELTKLHEEILEGSAREVRELLAAGGRVRGELIVMVEGSPVAERGAEEAPVDMREGRAARDRLGRELLQRPWAAKLSRRDLADLLASALGLSRNAAYRLAQEGKASTPRRGVPPEPGSAAT